MYSILKNPQSVALNTENVGKTLDYIDKHWQNITHQNIKDTGTLIGLPNPYIIPSADNGMQFSFEEQYYWDTFFVLLGLKDQKYKNLAKGMIENFAAIYERFGVIPNASRFYFLSRSQPPLLTSMINLYKERFGCDDAWFDSMMRVAEDEYHNVWMSKKHPHWRRVGDLNRYYDINALHDLAEAESGWDMTPRFNRKCLDYYPADLNALLYKYEVDFARWYTGKGDEAAAAKWDAMAQERAKYYDALLWSNNRKFYFDYNFTDKKRSLTWSLAGFYPLWVGMVSKERAAELLKQLSKFEKRGGLTTTTRPIIDKTLFGSVRTQWAYPNGWAPLQWIVINGLENYGYKEEANRLAKKLLKTCSDWYVVHKEIIEKYNVVNPAQPPKSGVYPDQSGFGWTNGVFADLADTYA